MKSRHGPALLCYLLALSCAPFPGHLMDEVARDVSFEDVIENPEAFTGKVVVWGGVVVETIPQPDDTLLIIRQAVLDFQKRPGDLDVSLGRFIIRHPGFLDPAIYDRGREVTVVGEIAGTRKRPVGAYSYTYPVIDARSLRLWEARQEIPRSDTLYHYPFFYPWRPYPWYPYPYRW